MVFSIRQNNLTPRVLMRRRALLKLAIYFGCCRLFDVVTQTRILWFPTNLDLSTAHETEALYRNLTSRSVHLESSVSKEKNLTCAGVPAFNAAVSCFWCVCGFASLWLRSCLVFVHLWLCATGILRCAGDPHPHTNLRTQARQRTQS